jgi:hypothetical protein
MKPLAYTLARAAALGIAVLAASGAASAQGALRPLEALVVNPESRPVPVVDKALAAAVQALASANGRAPYQQSIRFNQGMPPCTAFVCTVTFRAVPEGKRLVITHASARFGLPAGNLFATVELTDSSPNASGVLLPAPLSIGPGTFIASSPLTFYVEAGLSPVLMLQGNNVGFASLTATAAVVGYLVDAP